MELIQRHSLIGTLAATVICAYLAARSVNTLAAAALAPRPSLRERAGGARPALVHPQLDGERLAALFGVPLPKAQRADEAQPAAQPQRDPWTDEPQRSALHAVLAGTALAWPAQYSLCELIDSDRRETVVLAAGDTFMGARLYAIERDRVLIVNEGRNEFIESTPAIAAAGPPVPVAQAAPAAAQAEGIKQLSGDRYVIARKTIDGALSNLSQLATQARILPSFDAKGASDGFKLVSVVPDSLYAKIGIQNGDVIRRINGYEMNSPDKALELYQKLRDASRIEIELARRGESLRKSYSIE